MIIRNHTFHYTAFLLDPAGQHRRIPLTFFFFGEHFRVDVDGVKMLENCDLPALVDFDAARKAGDPLDSDTGVVRYELEGFKYPVTLLVSSRKEFGSRNFRFELAWCDLRVGRSSIQLDDDGSVNTVLLGTDCLNFVGQERALRAE